MDDIIFHIEKVLNDITLNEEDYIEELYYVLNELKRLS